MNVENAYIKSDEIGKVIAIVEARLNNRLEGFCCNNQIEVPDSYDSILAHECKRKVAISDPQDGCITLIESKEVNDYGMLIVMSRQLQTEILAVIQSDVIGAWGFVEIFGGKVVNSYYSEADDGVEELLKNKMSEKKIHQSLFYFREVVKEKGWNILQLKKE